MNTRSSTSPHTKFGVASARNLLDRHFWDFEASAQTTEIERNQTAIESQKSSYPSKLLPRTLIQFSNSSLMRLISETSEAAD
jgi:hypothetical protein